MDTGALIRPWLEALHDTVPGLEIFDAHTHIGQNDPDGMKCSPEELLATLEAAEARGCFVFPMHEPDGYPPANDAVLRAAAGSEGRFIPFCRVNPHADAVVEAERALDAGARGIKLHPRAEGFTLDHPEVIRLGALAAERGVPILVHAGRGIPALGRHAIELAAAQPDLRLILAHAAVCDLSWIWRVLPDHPGVLVDTSWFMPADMRTLFALVPPGQIVFASDAPYGATAGSAVIHLRYALQAGLSAAQIRSIAGEQALRVAAGEPLEACGPAPGERERAPHLLLDRVVAYLMLGVVATLRGGDGEELIALAEQACEVPDDTDDAPVFSHVRELLTAYRRAQAEFPDDARSRFFVIMAATVAVTPEVPLPPA